MSKYWLLVFCAGLWACNGAPKDNKSDVVNDSAAVKPNQSDSVIAKPDIAVNPTGPGNVADCDQVLNMMFQTSNYKPDPKNHLSDYKVHINEPGDAEDPSLGIQIFYTHGGDSSIAGVLNLDLKAGTLTDLSPQLDHPVALKFDSSYLKIIRKQCGN